MTAINTLMYPKVLVILAHPNLEKSFSNKLIIESLVDKNILVRDIAKLYPDFKINTDTEQTSLLEADVIIFQFPLYWYSVPGILKEWMDNIFVKGFAFGKDGHKLKDKKLLVSITAGSSGKLYPKETIEKIVFPFKGLADYCKMNYLGEVFSYEMADYSEEAREKTKNNAKIHSKQLLEFIV